MEINIKDILTLEDNHEYVVVSKMLFEDKTYYYIIDKDNLKNIKFCYEDKGDLVEITNKLLIAKLIPRFLKNIPLED
jgi:hypothetical protein